MKVYYCQKEFNKAVEFLYHEHKEDLFSEAQLRSILKDLLKRADRASHVSSAGFTVIFLEDEDTRDSYYAEITVTPYLSYTDEEDQLTYLEM